MTDIINIILLGIVIIYPVVTAMIQSFTKDKGLDPVTGLFVEGGSAGFSNYTSWILQQCNAPGGGTISCPPGASSTRRPDTSTAVIEFLPFDRSRRSPWRRSGSRSVRWSRHSPGTDQRRWHG